MRLQPIHRTRFHTVDRVSWLPLQFLNFFRNGINQVALQLRSIEIIVIDVPLPVMEIHVIGEEPVMHTYNQSFPLSLIDTEYLVARLEICRSPGWVKLAGLWHGFPVLTHLLK